MECSWWERENPHGKMSLKLGQAYGALPPEATPEILNMVKLVHTFGALRSTS